MGICASASSPTTAGARISPEQKNGDKHLNDKLTEDKRKDARVHKLLLLGAGESGKSTLFKQLSEIYGNGFKIDDRREFIPVIHSNTIEGMQTLVKASDRLAAKNKKFEITEKKSLDAKASLMRLSAIDDPLTERICEEIRTLWNDKSIKETYKLRGSSYYLGDSAKYFIERAGYTWKKDYCPTLQDLFRSRVRTSGILEMDYVYQKTHFKVFDVGGQRNERKKWIHLFQKVTAVIFVAALSGYNQVLYESKKEKRMMEALRLFEEICNLRWFSSTNIILFLNKSDLFIEMLPSTGLEVCFEDYKGDRSFAVAINFIKTKFEERSKNQIYTHVTNAIDTRNCSYVFNTCQDIIIRKCLEDAGLLMA